MQEEKNTRKELLDWALHIIIALILGFLVVTFVVQRTAVHGASMEPSLHNGDQLIIEKISPKLKNIRHGDIVTIYVPEELQEGQDYIIKRVIGLPGDRVVIKEGCVFVNGVKLDEDYINGDYTYVDNDRFEATIEDGTVYVLGDNRLSGKSKDSRSIGAINIEKVRGKAILRFYPFNAFEVIKNPQILEKLD
jgi:signal peptidase I